MELDAFESRVGKQPWGCWTWLGWVNKDGYGELRIRGRSLKAHRFSYELHVGPIPEGLTLDHICRNRACVNPFHLQPVTARENILRSTSPGALNARKTHCRKGHPYDDANTMWVRNGTARVCRECQRVKSRKLTKGPAPKTHCKHGHEFTEANVGRDKDGRRFCKECARVRAREAARVKFGRTPRELIPKPTHCPHGHEYTLENTYTYERKGRPYFYCRACNREHAARRRAG